MKRLFAVIALLGGCFSSVSMSEDARPAMTAGGVRVSVTSSIDGAAQQCRLWSPDHREPRPLLVFLHSWSHNWKQDNTRWMKQCQDRNWVFLQPDFRGANNSPAACGSSLAQQDILDAIRVAKRSCSVDESRIYLAGTSGGGHMAMLMAAKYPHEFTAVSAWCGISSLSRWHRQTEESRKWTKYAREMDSICGGPPGKSSVIDEQYRQRSPLTFLNAQTAVPIDISAGIHDGHIGSVPVSQSVRAFNASVPPGDRVGDDELSRLLRRDLDASWQQADESFGVPIHFRRETNDGRRRLTLFEGGHEDIPQAGAAWLTKFRKTVEVKPDVAKKPNILFIMSDDHTTQAIGAYGSRLAKLNPTPTIDSLANNGIRFDRVYCNNSICTPSRASIVTGQYPQRNGVLDLRGKLPPEKQYLPREMKKAGYQTAMIGKWHLKEEPATFDYYCVLPGQGRYFDPEFRVRGPKPWTQNTIKKPGKHSSDAITDLSIRWLAEDWDREKPFFLMHHFKAPHDMFVNAKRYDSYLEEVEIPEPANLRSVPPSGLGSGLMKGHEPWMLGKRLKIDQSLEEPEYSKQVYQAYLKRYLRCVKGVDDNVKRLLDHLKEIGELDNTVILYTGDQGFFLGEHDLMDKRWMYEEAFRMPFIVHAPGIVKQAGCVNDWLINNTDFAPTMLELAGSRTPELMQGRSFAAAIRGEPKPEDWRTSLYYRYWMHMAHRLAVPAHFGLRTDRHKLMFLYGVDYASPNRTPPTWEFYDLERDPSEDSNEYGNPEYADVIRQLKAELKRLRTELDETDARYPAIQKVIEANWN